MIQTDVFKTLSEDTAVSAIVSTRIYPIRLPPGAAVPAVVYTVSDITPVKSLDGESGLDNGNVEIICWAKDYKSAQLLAEVVRAAFVADGQGVMIETMHDTEDEETRNYGVVMNINIWSE